MPVIDTTLLIDFKREDSQAVAALRRMAGSTLVVPPLVAAEFLTKSRRPAVDLADLHRAFSIPAIHDDWILVAATLRKQLHAQGALLRIPDLWIGAWARLLKTYVVTANARHFRAMGIPAWHYPTEDKPPR